MRLADPSLYLIADATICTSDLGSTVAKAIEGGVTLIQYRDKAASDRELFETATSLLAVCQARNVPLVINDRVDVALAVGADGVHLGVDDLPIQTARQLLGARAIVGYSPETDAQIQTAASWGATYLGIGPMFTTTTKPDAGIALGILEFQRRRAHTDLPVVAIGGITAWSAGRCLAAGASGVAVASAIMSSRDPREAARSFTVR